MTWLGYISNPRYILNYFSFPLRVRDSAGFYCICSNSSHIFAATLVDTHIFVSPTQTFEAAVVGCMYALRLCKGKALVDFVPLNVYRKCYQGCTVENACEVWHKTSLFTSVIGLNLLIRGLSESSIWTWVMSKLYIYIYTEPIKLPTLYDHRRESFASVTRCSIPATMSAFSFLLI